MMWELDDDRHGQGRRDLEFIGCPDCGAPAEIVWRTELSSTDGPIEHIDVRCIRRHNYFMPAGKGLAA